MFISSSDLNSSLYPEIQAAISRGQSILVDIHINEALGYIESRLMVKYDIRGEFEKTGTARHPLLLKLAKDISVYYLYDLPETIPAKRVKAFDDAVKYLDQLVKGEAVLAGVPPPDATEIPIQAGNIFSGSETKRNNRL